MCWRQTQHDENLRAKEASKHERRLRCNGQSNFTNWCVRWPELTHGPVEAKGGEEWAGVTLVAGGFDGVQQPDGVCGELAFCHLSWHMAAAAKHRISCHRSRDDRRLCRRENGAPRHRSHCKRGAWQGSCTPTAPSQPPDPSSGAALGRCSGTAGTRETTRRPHHSRSVGYPSRPRLTARQGGRLMPHHAQHRHVRY